MNIYAGKSQSAPEMTIPVAWEIQRYNAFPPRQLWLSIDGQPAEVVLTHEFYDTVFSPDREWIAFIQDGLTVQKVDYSIGSTIHMQTDALGEPISNSDGVSLIGLKWIDSQQLLFNARDTYLGSFYSPNHMDLHYFDLRNHSHMELFPDNSGGWAFPDPTGRYVAVFNHNTLRLFNSADLTQPRKTLSFDQIQSGRAYEVPYPVLRWSGDGDTLMFNIVENDISQTCSLTAQTLEINCGDPVPDLSRYAAVSSNLEYIASNIAYNQDNQIKIVQRLPNADVQKLTAIQGADPGLPLAPVRWINDQMLLYRAVVDYCADSLYPASSRYYTYSLESHELSEWLNARSIIEVQQLNAEWFAVAAGDCYSVNVELYNIETEQFIRLAELSHANPIYWFRFVP
jgi:hypothetical protein